jgi:S-DNA-T family DNA segregation ATPase FtsK/SpoIIIE
VSAGLGNNLGAWLTDFYRKFAIGRELGATLLRGLRESALLLYLAVSMLLLISLLSFHMNDPGWRHPASSRTAIHNAAGSFGAWLADFFLSVFGISAYLLPFILAIHGLLIYRNAEADKTSPLDRALRWAGFIIALTAATGITERFMIRPRISLPEGYGGILGQEVSDHFFSAFGTTGMTILLVALFLAGVSLFSGLSWVWVLDGAGACGLRIVEWFTPIIGKIEARQWLRRKAEAMHPASAGATLTESEPLIRHKREEESFPAPALPVAASPSPTGPISIKPRKPEKKSNLAPVHVGELPSLDLLNNRAPRIRGYSNTQLEEMSRQLESILDDFGVEVQVMEVHPGPVITRFEVQPAPGVKVSRISGLAKDLARTLSVTSVRVVEIIPGKTVIGLEIPNEERETVLLHSVLASSVYQDSHSPLTLTLGKDISGNPVVANLARMPHLLVAGTTGSGKSVAVNVMILSMLYKARPDDVRLIMIDPKMLELSIYEGIPHLLTPVVTDMKEAANALRWCVAEMERRYKLMSLMGVRNLAGFNQKITEAIAAGEPIRDPLWSPDLMTENDEAPFLEPLPFIVIVIDELADMMMIVGKKVEELIARLAQKARAAGLHLILATQRPSVDVITGLIKANIPTRLAFQVSSKIDSRTILDQGGAESLLGNGDMLYLPPGTGLPMRAHGAFVSDDEVHHVVEFLKRTGPPDYIEDITRFPEDGGGDFSGYKGSNEGGEESDALYDEAVRFVTESRKASISSVQRRFKVGYNRAARMIEDMENAGIVGPAETNGSREVLAPPPPSLD